MAVTMAATVAAGKPVILLAFANDPADGINYLRNLPEEARQVRAALEYAEAQGLCEFEVRYNATLDDILSAFQNPKLRGRIAVLHYGGHADSYELLFQSSAGNLQRIDGRGFAAFLAEQRSLQLVFLNACTTEPQIDSLLDANVQVVIATAQEVDDSTAAALAGLFYQNLAHGDTIGSSYRQAVAALRAQKGDDPSLFYMAGAAPAGESAPPATEQPATEQPATGQPATGQTGGAPAGQEAGGGASGGFWPWLLRTHPGAESAAGWSLPLAAGDPLFGLPPLPPKPLPDSPYQRALDYYTRDLAELFFGRGPQIRDLYQRVTASGRSSVILYYGQSGVGKSSLLDAGLAPRLAATHAVLYARRDRTLGLLGTLRKQLDADAQTPLAQAWRAAEERWARPVVLILDQAEELFTRRSAEQPNELADFAEALRTIEGGGEGKPAGVLLLGFRKERLAEIESALRAQSIDFAKVYLAPLDAGGIEEVVCGPVRSERLAAKYGLTIDDELPQVIAYDLTADPDSPVAPTLNILLRKLWAAATAKSASSPHFSLALYEQLRRDGILLDDFLRQQVATLAQEQPEAVSSGFLLDLWAFHTTPLGTSEQRDAAELQAAYAHRQDLTAAVLRSKELYVLAEPSGDSAAPAAGAGTRLAHDTLAPLVRRDYEQSTLPGQQARRLLESRAVDWSDGRSGVQLDDAALAVVDQGLAGMRSLAENEQRLLAASRQAQIVRLRQKRFARAAAAGAAIAILLLLAMTLLFWNNQQLAVAQSAEDSAKVQLSAERTVRLEAERLAGEERNRATQLANQLANERERSATRLAQVNESQRIAQLAQQQLAVDPVVGLHLALAALDATRGQPPVPEAEYALRQAVLTSRERKYVMATVGAPDQVAIRVNRVATGGAAPAVYDLELNAQAFPFPPDFTNIQGLRWGNDGRLLGWSQSSVWVTGGGEPQQFTLADDGGEQVRCAEWQPAQRWVAICTYDALLAWQPESGQVITLTTQLDTPDLPTEPRSAVWSADGRWLAGLGARLLLWDSSAPQSAAQIFYPPPEAGQPVSFAYWLPDNNSLVAGWFASMADRLELQIWRAGATALEAVPLPPELALHMQVRTVYAPDPRNGGSPRLLLWASDGLLALYGIDGQLLAQAANAGENLNGAVLSPSGERVLSYSADGSATIWLLDDFTVFARLDVANQFVAGALTSAFWLDENTPALVDESALIQIVRRDDLSSGLSITSLAGYPRSERIAQVLRLANGRLLTAGYTDSSASSLRIWQVDPVATRVDEKLPAATEPLCSRLQRAVSLPAGLGRPMVVDWQPGDQLLVTDRNGQVAQWSIGGATQLLPADDDRRLLAFAPDHVRVLRYGSAADGQIWRLTAQGWQQESSLAGDISAAAWSDYGILVSFADDTVVVVDPDRGQRRPAPDATRVAGSSLLSPDLLLALRNDAVELWKLGDAQPLATWPVPPGRRLRLDDAAADGQLFVYSDATFGQIYVLRVNPAAQTLSEVWRFEQAHVDRAPARLNPTLPLLATLNDGMITLVDLDQGRAIWQSTSAAAVAGQSFRTVQWSTDGLYLITQAQLPNESSFILNIGVWRWDGVRKQPALLQEAKSSGLLGVSPDTQLLLAGEPGLPFAERPHLYPILTDTDKLETDVQASCLLDRPLADEQRQAFSIDGR